MLECVDGFHGDDCQSACDYCNKSSPGCRQSDGHCLNGCESNINIDKCKGLYPYIFFPLCISFSFKLMVDTE